MDKIAKELVAVAKELMSVTRPTNFRMPGNNQGGGRVITPDLRGKGSLQGVYTYYDPYVSRLRYMSSQPTLTEKAFEELKKKSKILGVIPTIRGLNGDVYRADPSDKNWRKMKQVVDERVAEAQKGVDSYYSRPWV